MRPILKTIGSLFWQIAIALGTLIILNWLLNINKLVGIAFGLVGLWWIVRELLLDVLKSATADVLFGHNAGLRSEIAAALGIVRSDGDYSSGLQNKISEAIRSKEVQATLSETIQDALLSKGH